MDTKPASGALDVDLEAIRWMLAELRVGFVAQSLGTAGPVDRISAATEVDHRK